MITFEFTPPTTDNCECCGGTTTRLTRFVYRDNDAYAIYYAMFSDNHPNRIVKLVISLGEWGENAEPSQRKAFSLDLRTSQDNYEVAVTNAADCPWRGKQVLGRVLDREEALNDPLIEEVFHLSDHIVIEDLPLKDFLDASRWSN